MRHFFFCVRLTDIDCIKHIFSLENNFEDTDDVTVDFKSAIVPPNKTQLIPIYFHPLKVGHYNLNVLLQVNSDNFTVKLQGIAVRPNLQTLLLTDKIMNLGKIKVGTTKRFPVQIINRTPAKIQPTFGLWEQLFDYQEEKVEPEISVPVIPPPPPSSKSKKDKKKKGGGSKSTKSSKKSKKSKGTQKSKSSKSKDKKKKGKGKSKPPE